MKISSSFDSSIAAKPGSREFKSLRMTVNFLDWKQAHSMVRIVEKAKLRNSNTLNFLTLATECLWLHKYINPLFAFLRECFIELKSAEVEYWCYSISFREKIIIQAEHFGWRKDSTNESDNFDFLEVAFVGCIWTCDSLSLILSGFSPICQKKVFPV